MVTFDAPSTGEKRADAEVRRRIPTGSAGPSENAMPCHDTVAASARESTPPTRQRCGIVRKRGVHALCAPNPCGGRVETDRSCRLSSAS